MFTGLIDHAGINIILADPQGIITHYNPVAQKFYGYPPASVIGQSLAMFLPTHNRADHERAMWTVTREQQSADYQTEHRLQNGQIVAVRVMLSPIRDAEGHLVGLSQFTTDIDQQMQTQNALQRDRDVMEAILETTNDAIIMIDLGNKILAMNLQSETMFQLPRFNLVGQSLQRLVDAIRARADLPKAFSDLFVTYPPDSYNSAAGDFEVPEPDRRIFLWYSAPVNDHEGYIMGRLFVFRDATHEREVDRMKTEFVSLVSHELRTPLTSIRGFAEMMLDGDTGEINDEARMFLDIIKVNAHRLSTLINDILDLTKIESGRLSLKADTYLVEEIFSMIEDSMRLLLQEKQQTLTVEIAPDLPEIWVDFERITQILVNLLGNASKYSDSGKHIRLQAKLAQTQADMPKTVPIGITYPAFLFAVADEGMGIELKDQPHVFQRFYRTDEVSRRQIQGSGLGLTIVKSFVELHGGKIWLESELKVGTTIYFTIPFVGWV
jgi:PAS domain S-box-containing protein